MKWLVRLYPAAWRERYGDEMEALLEERPLGPFDLLDLFLGALDAHLHLRGLRQTSGHEKGFTMSQHIAGYAVIVSGFLFLLMGAMLIPDSTSDDSAPISMVFGFGAALALLVGIAGLSALQTRRYRSLVWLSFALVAAGVATFILAIFAGAGESSFGNLGWVLFMVSWLVMPIGSLMFGMATIRTAVFSRRSSYALIVGPGAMISTFITAMVFDWDDRTALALVIVGLVGFAAAWIFVGIEGIRSGRAPIITRPRIS